MKRRITELWRQRPPRERRIAGTAALLVVLALLYAYAWLPLSHERASLSESAPVRRAHLLEMRLNAAEAARLQAAARPAPVDLRKAIEQSAETHGIRKAIAQIDPESAGRVRVRLPAVRASDWLAWVARLQSEHGIRLESVRMDSLPDAEMTATVATFTSGR